MKTKHLGIQQEFNDKSPKGKIDDLILPFMELINVTQYQTLSSCSGRIVLWLEKRSVTQRIESAVTQSPGAIEKGTPQNTQPTTETTKTLHGQWLFVSHDPVTFSSLFTMQIEYIQPTTLQPTWQSVYFKFEPFILHVESPSYEAAQRLFTLVYNLGWRQSGMVPSKKHMVMIKSTLKLDVPIGYFDIETRVLYSIVSKEYLELLVEIGMQKFTENRTRMDRLLQVLRTDLASLEE
jgi:tRNA wybutosine-synthesizing protein 3